MVGFGPSELLLTARPKIGNVHRLVPISEMMPKKKAASKSHEPLPCPVCGKKPEVKADRSPENGILYYCICEDSTPLGWHKIYTPSWETCELAISRWNHAITTWEKRQVKNIKEAEVQGE
jgi:hypothetical protein